MPKLLVGDAVQTLRRSKGWMRSDLAELTDISEVMIAKIEQGVRFPSPKNLTALAEAFGVDPEFLVEENKRLPKSGAKQRQVVITINYHYTSPGRRVSLRSDLADAVRRLVIRRLERHGSLVVDDVQIKDV